jgi:filamentous hemagglutinin
MSVRPSMVSAHLCRPSLASREAKFTNRIYAEGWSTTPPGIQTTSGVIPATPNKTTTVLGSFISDTRGIIGEQLNLTQADDFLAAKPGGFNLLNVTHEFTRLGAEEFWLRVNKPFLDAAISRGDEIALATKPTEKNMHKNGKITGFGREIKYLECLGYHYDPLTLKMIRH